MSNNTPYTLSELYVIASKYNTKKAFRKKAQGAYMSVVRRFPEYFNDICSHMIKLVKPKQTLEDIRKEALKYEYFTDFVNNSSSSYMIMRQRFSDDVDYICSHLIRSGHNAEWTLDLLKKEALKYTTKKDFQVGNSGAYTIMYRRYFEEVEYICSHMIVMNKGFKHNEPAILYYLSVNDGQAYKIGVTNKTVAQRYNKCDLDKINVILALQYDTGKEAYAEEQKILKEFSFAQWDGDDLLQNGNTELFKYDVLNLHKKEKKDA